MNMFPALFSVLFYLLLCKIYQFRDFDAAGADHSALKVVFTRPDTVFIVK